MHEAHGVRLHLGTTVAGVAESGDGTIVAELSDGVRVEADGLLVGVGATPNVGWLEGSGLEVGPSGVACDETLLVAPGVVAAGDLARWMLPGPDGRLAPVRVEHRTTAAEQGDHAAATLLGDREPFVPVPYVWSDQYGLKIQVLGLPQPEDETVVVAGDVADGRAVIACGRAGRLSAVIGLGMPRALMQLRPLLVNGAGLEEASGLLD
jgi:3-phenylpropionate/trans-cinnamate dioxygenase ferredoxin reductase subunit